MKTVFSSLALGSLLSTLLVIEAFDLRPTINKNIQKIKVIEEASRAIKNDLTSDTVERTFTDYYRGGHKYATVITDNNTGEVLDCMLIGDREFIGYMIGDNSVKWSGPILDLASDMPSIPIINVTTEEIDDYIDRCNNGEAKNETKPFFQKFISTLGKGPQAILKYAVIFPGTKWCGAGDVARNYDDLGRSSETDKCCRDHDHAIESLARGEEKHGLKNKLLYTMTKCTDDEQFNQCLFDAGTVHSGAVGTTYFNVLKTKCFDKRKKAVCTKRLIPGITPCMEYKYDENSPETWQIFDAKAFVPNASLPVQKLNEIMYSAPGIGDLMTLI